MQTDKPLTPLMARYARIKGQLSENTLLLYRLGDFYELFFDDAKQAAVILKIALTKRNGFPMAGIPIHASKSFISALIAAGKQVAIFDDSNPEARVVPLGMLDDI